MYCIQSMLNCKKRLPKLRDLYSGARSLNGFQELVQSSAVCIFQYKGMGVIVSKTPIVTDDRFT